MPGMGSGPKPIGGLGLKGIAKLALTLLIIIGAIYIGWRIYGHFKNNNQPAGTITVNQYDKASQASTQSSLQSKDYNSYINKQVILSGEYLAAKDYKNAERVMDEVFADVPSGKLNSTAYSQMVSVQQAQGDTAKYKHYLGLLVKQLNKEGDTKGAVSAQMLLDQAK
jgi:hypothetical protein